MMRLFVRCNEVRRFMPSIDGEKCKVVKMKIHLNGPISET